MSMLERVKTALQGVDVVPSRTVTTTGTVPGTGVRTGTGAGTGLGLATDRILVTAPRTGATWKSGSEARVDWVLTGTADYPVSVTLVQINGVMAEDIAVLAAGVDPTALSVTVTVPTVDPGADYAVFVNSADPTGVYSPTFTICA